MGSPSRFASPPSRFPVPILTVDAGAVKTLSLDRPGLVIFADGGLPIGQIYAEPGMDDLEAAAAAALVGRARPLSGAPGTVSVVICTRDRPDELARCLASFASQSLRPDEVIVVDNASIDDRTRSVAEAAGVSYVREDRPGLDYARNTGAQTAKSEIVAYTDDDVILHPDWLKNLVSAFDSPEIDAVTGLVLPAELATEAQYLFETEWGFGRGYRRIDFDRGYYDRTRGEGCPAWDVGAGASMAFRRSLFDRIGFFDTRLDVGAAGCSGDSEYWYRILHNGGTCRYEPTAVAYHFHRRQPEALGRQLKAYMSGHTAALLVQYERTGEKGNIRRLLKILPREYYYRARRRLRRGLSDGNRFVFQEILGCLKGVAYYFIHRRRPSP